MFKYIEKNKLVKNNVFTSVKQIKDNFTLQFMGLVVMPQINSITLVNGDYEGYIFNLKSDGKEVSILKNGKRYVFMFLKSNYFTDDYIEELLNTVVID